MTRAQVTGRGRDPPGCSGCSESVLLHGEPRQQRWWYVDGSRRSKISAIHYPRQEKFQRNYPFRFPVLKKPNVAIIMSSDFQVIRAPFQPCC